MTPLAIIHDNASEEKAISLSTTLDAPIIHDTTGRSVDFILHVTQTGLALEQCRSGFKPLSIDPQAAEFQARQRSFGKNQPLAKAIGIKKAYRPSVLDTTAGLGRDALLMASLGCNVTLLERHPVLFCLLKEALNLPVYQANAIDWLPKQSSSFDVIYVDPMFPTSKKSALVKKNMQMLQQLVGEDSDSDQLLDVARRHAKKRVVVKRHLHAPTLNALTPTTSIKTKTLRFDIYIAENDDCTAKGG